MHPVRRSFLAGMLVAGTAAGTCAAPSGLPLAAVVGRSELVVTGSVTRVDAAAGVAEVVALGTPRGHFTATSFRVAAQRPQDLPVGTAAGGPAVLFVGRHLGLVHVADTWLLTDRGDGATLPTYRAGLQDPARIADVRAGFGGGTRDLLSQLPSLAAVKVPSRPAAAPRRQKRDSRGLTVEATLKAMSRVPALKDLGTYQESLIVCEWQVDKVASGTLPATSILAYHWSFVARQPQAAVTWTPGEKRTLTLRPLDEVPETRRFRVDDDIAATRLDLPAFYDTALGEGLPAALAKADSVGAFCDESLRTLAPVEGSLKFFGTGDCRVADGFASQPFYGGAAKDSGLVINFGEAGSSLAQQDLRMRLPVIRCRQLEWGFWGGGPSRARGGFPEPLIAPQFAWPRIAGRAPAPTDTAIDVRILPGAGGQRQGFASVARCGVIENWVREYNRRGLKFMTGLILTANAGSPSRIDGMGPEQVPVLYERWLALSRIYPNYCFIERTDIGQSWGIRVRKITPTAILEEWRVRHDARNQSPHLYAWSSDPADLCPDDAAIGRAVDAARSGSGDLIIGGAWIAGVMAGKGTIAAVNAGTTADAELALRSAVAAGRKPMRVVWGIEPLMFTAPREEKPIGALPGPAWPTLDPKDSGPPTTGPIRLGYGTTVARGKGVWEFGLEYYLIFEAALAECRARGIPVIVALAPNDAGIPEVAYQGMADRLRALTLQYKGVRFVDPGAEIAGYLADVTKGVYVSAIKPPS